MKSRRIRTTVLLALLLVLVTPAAGEVERRIARPDRMRGGIR